MKRKKEQRVTMVSQRETIKGFALDLVLFLFLRSKNNNKHGKQKKHVSYAFKTFGFNKPKGAYCCFQIEDLNQPFVSQRETIRNHASYFTGKNDCHPLGDKN